MWGESKTAERQRGKEEREGAFMKMSDGVCNIFDHWRKYLWQMWEDNPRQSR